MLTQAHREADQPQRLMEAYKAWRAESAATAEAYGRWADAGADEQEALWAAYEHLHEREQRTSMVYLEIAEQVAGHAHWSEVTARAVPDSSTPS